MKNQHNKIIQFIVFCSFSISCNNKTIDVEKLDTITTETIDLKRFQDTQKDGLIIISKKIDLKKVRANYFKYTDHDTLIEVSETEKFYIEKKNLNGTQFKWINAYNKINLLLRTEVNMFSNMPIWNIKNL